jgi:hypothetical protein
MYIVICEEAGHPPSPPLPLKAIADALAAAMTKKTGKKYKVVDADAKEELQATNEKL